MFFSSDINECRSHNGGCEQGCVNIRGSHRCTCRTGYKLQKDKRSCRGKKGNHLFMFSVNYRVTEDKKHNHWSTFILVLVNLIKETLQNYKSRYLPLMNLVS